jgi:hypothetical protein
VNNVNPNYTAPSKKPVSGMAERKPRRKKITDPVEVVARALCRLSDPDELDTRGKPMWQTYEREARKIVAALEGATATVADHIEPLKGDPVRFWYGELQSLCVDCHDVLKQQQATAPATSTGGLSTLFIRPIVASERTLPIRGLLRFVACDVPEVHVGPHVPLERRVRRDISAVSGPEPVVVDQLIGCSAFLQKPVVVRLKIAERRVHPVDETHHVLTEQQPGIVARQMVVSPSEDVRLERHRMVMAFVMPSAERFVEPLIHGVPFVEEV